MNGFVRSALIETEAESLEEVYCMADLLLQSDIKRAKRTLNTNKNTYLKYHLESKVSSLRMRYEAIMTVSKWLNAAADNMNLTLHTPPLDGACKADMDISPEVRISKG